SISEEIAVTTFVHAGVQPAANAKRDAAVRIQLSDRLEQLKASVNRLERVSEGGMNPIAGHLNHVAAVAFDGSPRERVMSRQRRPHRLGSFFPKAGACFDVGEEKGRDTGQPMHAVIPPIHERLEVYCAVNLLPRAAAGRLQSGWRRQVTSRHRAATRL